MKDTRILVLAGAGLVQEAGLPTSVELAHKLKEDLLEACATQGQESLKANEAVACLAALRFLVGGIRFQRGILNRDPDEEINIEQVAVAAIELQQRLRNPLAPYMSGWHDRLIDLERQNPETLRLVVDFIYSQLDKWLATPRASEVAYLARLGDLHESGVRLDIFSLNYDLCIEKALTDSNRSFLNGFTSDAGWSPDELVSASVPIRLFKLHGSLDWIEDELYGLCSIEFPVHSRREDLKTEGSRPLLIFGTAHKLSPREPFLTLAYHFARGTLDASVLAIIGYSFGDEHVNEIIRQAMKKNRRLRVIVVSPDAELVIARQEFLARQPRVTSIAAKAKVALNDSEVARRVRDLLKEAASEEPFNS
jgi:hypothetical protein